MDKSSEGGMLRADLSKAFNLGGMLFTDLSKAFDCLRHNLLNAKLAA